MKKFCIVFIFVFVLSIINYSVSQDVSIIPNGGGNVPGYVSGISQGGKVRSNYRDTVKNGNLTLGQQFASGILSWDSILDYFVYLVKFIGQVALLVGALAIIFLGYKRILKNILPEPNNFGKIILGLLIIVFAYVIVKLIWYAFIS